MYRIAIIGILCLWPTLAMAEREISVRDAGPPSPPASSSDAPKEAAKNPSPKIQEKEGTQYNTIALQGLNKVTGHISRLEGPVGTVLQFGNLEIIARRCWKANPEERPENAALLEISEMTPGEPPHGIFLGWMFASSPGLSGLEHPVYDITVLACSATKEPEAAAEKKSEKKEEKKDEKKPDEQKPVKTEEKAEERKPVNTGVKQP